METLDGRRFGRLVAVRMAQENGSGGAAYICRCDCGGSTKTKAYDLRSGKAQSCGCARRETLTAMLTTHGGTRRPEFRVWLGIRRRCHDEKDRRFKDYGGRGIKVCPQWREDFGAFFADMGPRPSPHHQIERRDNDGDYEPSNCCWATRLEQARNRRNVAPVTFGGETLTVRQWAIRLGFNIRTIHSRIYRGAHPMDALGFARPLDTPQPKAE